MSTQIDIPNIPTALPEIFRKILSGQLPSPAEFVDQHLVALGTVEAGLILVAGLTFLLFGWGAFKLFVIGNGAYFGGMVGAYMVGTHVGPNWALLGMLAGGLMLAVLSLPLIRYAITIVGGLGGGLGGYHSWPHIVRAFARDDLAQYPWVGALIGIFLLGLFAFAMFRLMVMIVTAFEGSILAFSGAVALCLQHPAISARLRTALMTRSYVLPAIISVATVIGFALQYNAAMRHGQPKGSSSEKNSGGK